MPLMRKLFGTDGVRGEAGVDLTEAVARDLGAAAARFAGAGERILIGRDTRESGPMLEAALVDGIVEAGGVAVTAGVIPTPGVAVLAAQVGARLGCVISASHNPYRDNGIKFLGGDGRKLPDVDEARIESLMDGPSPGGGRVERFDDACERYVTWLAETFGEGVPSGTMLGIDCANGAASAPAGSAASPTAATSTPASARRTSTPSPTWCAGTGLRSGWRSTATPTAAWAWTPPAGP
jgi:phosphoglucosamine mutase